MSELSWALAGQILVTAVLAVFVGCAIVAGCAWLLYRYLEREERRALRQQLRQRAVPRPASWTTADVLADEDDGHEDFEHMRVVREAATP